MTFSFVCPAPCNHQVNVEAQNQEEAITKLITAGAMRCRNLDKKADCEVPHLILPPLSSDQLRDIMRFSLMENQSPSFPAAMGKTKAA
jgi:hypothetical protein